MQNIKLTIAYDGFRYSGWQVQAKPKFKSKSSKKPNNKPTIQGEIEKVLKIIFKKKITLIGSGRTDAGVHAIGQIANFKTEKDIKVEQVKSALNGLLPKEIVIKDARRMSLDFHARFSAVSKIYRYVILNTEEKAVFVRPYCLWVKSSLDLKFMGRESRSLLGRHNFKAFQAQDKANRSSMVNVKRVSIRRGAGSDSFPFLQGLELITIDIEADRFLYNMVRNIVGTLIEFGKGKFIKGDLAKILKKENRRFAGPCASACGLYLVKVNYE